MACRSGRECRHHNDLANFQGADPNEELVEVSVRRTCFFPARNHVNYITVRGLNGAATGDGAATSQQWGMIAERV